MQDQVRTEISTLDSWEDAEGLANLTFFNAFLSETMRLYPVVPTGGIRMTKSEGVRIGNQYIPPETTIVAPRYTLSRRKCHVHFGTPHLAHDLSGVLLRAC